jgi:hypothetical protein
MNLERLQEKLLAAARGNPPSDRVPLAFEKRVLANLTSKPQLDLTALWSRALWRATVPCLALTILLTSLSLFPTNSTDNSGADGTVTATTEDLSTVFEETLLASSDQLTAFDFLEEKQ